jgi:CTP:molybdopterin cytidylyltransferase MocA
MGEPLLRRIVRIAADANPDHLIVVLGSSAYDCVPVIKNCGADIVVNPFWETGLAGSIRLGVERAEEECADSILLLLADQPWLNADLIQQFFNRLKGESDMIIAARYEGTLGAPMMFGSDWFATLKTLEGDQGARNIVAKEGNRVQVIEWSDGAVDVDTPDDLAGLMRGVQSMQHASNASREGEFRD